MTENNFTRKDYLKELDFLKIKIFYGLKNLNDGFDVETEYYFSEKEFEIILDRIEDYNIGIYGIEPFLNGEFYGVLTCEQYETEPNDKTWYKKAFEIYKEQSKELQYSATYMIPNELITKK